VWAWILGALGACLLIACIGVFFVANRVGSAINSPGFQNIFSSALAQAGAEIAVTSFYTSLRTGNYEDAYSNLGGSLASSTSASTLEQQAKSLNITGIKSNLSSLPSSTDTSTTINQTITYGNGQTFDTELTVEKQSDGNWKITEASPSLLPTSQ